MIARATLVGALCFSLIAACSGGTTHDNAKQTTAGSSGDGTAGTDTASPGTSGSVGASGASGAGGKPNKPVTNTGDFAQDYATAVCELLSRCYVGLLPQGNDCVPFFAGTFRESSFPPIDAAVAAGTITYHPEAVKACLEQVATASCDWTALDQCNDIWVGKTPVGSSCSLNLECSSGHCLGASQCPSVCAPKSQAGDVCTAAPNTCADGLKCVADSGTVSHCVKGAGLGETCSRKLPCRGYTLCVGIDEGVPDDTGTCATQASLHTVKQGELCESLDDLLCEGDLVCTTTLEDDIVVGRCQPKVKSGAACTFSVPDACPDGEYCLISSATGVKPATGECHKDPQLGEVCSSNASLQSCPIGQYCDGDSRVCSLTKANGEACSDTAQCKSRSCRDGKCALNLDCGED